MQTIGLLTVNIIIGLIICFYGKKLYFPLMMGSIFVVSLIMCYQQNSNFLGILVGIVVGIILALLSKMIYKFGVFLLGCMTGLVFGTMILSFVKGNEGVVLLICSLFIGTCGLFFHDTFVKIMTAYNGASLIAPSLCFFVMNLPLFNHQSNLTTANLNDFLNQQFISQNVSIVMGVTFVFTTIGFFYQRGHE